MEKEQDNFFLKKFDENYQFVKKLTTNVQEIINKNAEYKTLSNKLNIFLISLTVTLLMLFRAFLNGVKNIFYIFLILFWIAVVFKIFLLIRIKLAENKINKMEELYEKKLLQNTAFILFDALNNAKKFIYDLILLELNDDEKKRMLTFADDIDNMIIEKIKLIKKETWWK